MDIYNVTQTLGDTAPFLISGLYTQEAQLALATLAVYVVTLSIYSIFIFKFYRFLARRDVFELDLGKYTQEKHSGIMKFFAALLYVFKYLFVFPFVVFMWFTFLGLMLVFLSRGGNVEQVLMIAISLVGAIRICAYYSEDLSRDVSKMLPFALLGVFLVDVSYFSLGTSLATMYSVIEYWQLLTYYFLFIILLEFMLRIVSGIGRRVFKGKGEVEKER